MDLPDCWVFFSEETVTQGFAIKKSTVSVYDAPQKLGNCEPKYLLPSLKADVPLSFLMFNYSEPRTFSKVVV